MTSFQIKLLAVLTMAIDHIGLFFFPHVLILNLIGRMSFPLFAWLAASGARYSRNLNQYVIRLLGLATISEIPFLAANRQIDPSFFILNAVFTLSLGLLAILWIKKTTRPWQWLLITLIAALIAVFLKTDYGAAGVCSIVVFYLWHENLKKTIIAQLVICWTWYFIPTLVQMSLTHHISSSNLQNLIELASPISLIAIAVYNGKQGPKAKYLFYLFYPLQYVLIFLIQR